MFNQKESAMNKLLLFFLLLPLCLIAQQETQSGKIKSSAYENVPDNIKAQKPFMREWLFFEERAYPEGYIPENAYGRAMDQKLAMKQSQSPSEFDLQWHSIGPSPGAYFNWGSISSRIVTAAYHPQNPNIIFIGAANGGVWKTTDGGVNWQPLTDKQPSMSMGALAIDPSNPNIIYAGTGEATYSGASYYGRGLLKSTDGGTTWQQYTAGLPGNSYFSRIVISPKNSQHLLAAVGTAGLYRSTNGGESWTVLRSDRCDDVLFSLTGDTAFAIGSALNIIRSVDGGATFSSFSSGLPNGTRMHFDYCRNIPSIMYASVYSGSTVTAFKSTNFGVTWSQVATSYNFGGSQAWYDFYCRVHPKNPDVVYIGTIEIHRSTDGGVSFTNISQGYSGGTVHVDQHFLVFHPTEENTILALNDGGIYRSTNLGNSFSNLNQGLTLTQFYRITASPFSPTRILGGTQDNGTQQTFSSLNWSAAFGGDGGEVCFNPFNPNYIIGESQNGGLVRTTNGGNSWTNATSGINTSEAVAWVAPIIAHPTIDGRFYVARQRLYRSDDNGANWTAISANINGSSAVRELAISRTNPDIIYATSGSKVTRSTDGGLTFTNVTSNLPGKTISSIYVHPDSSNVVFVTLLGFGGNKVYKTTNDGASWVSINGNLPDSPVSDIFIFTENQLNPQIYFVASDIGVFMTTNGGVTWKDMDNGLPNTVIKHLDYSSSTKMLRAGTHGRGVYEASLTSLLPVELISFRALETPNGVLLNWQTASEKNNKEFQIERKFSDGNWEVTGIVQGKGTTTTVQSYQFTDFDNSLASYTGNVSYRLKQIDFDGSFEYSNTTSVQVNFSPDETSLYQNYPNPFNPATEIRYQIHSPGFVTLRVYDLLGNEIKTLVNTYQNAGRHTVTFNAEGIASGTYFYTLQTAEYKKTMKLLITK